MKVFAPLILLLLPPLLGGSVVSSKSKWPLSMGTSGGVKGNSMEVKDKAGGGLEDASEDPALTDGTTALKSLSPMTHPSKLQDHDGCSDIAEVKDKTGGLEGASEDDGGNDVAENKDKAGRLEDASEDDDGSDIAEVKDKKGGLEDASEDPVLDDDTIALKSLSTMTHPSKLQDDGSGSDIAEVKDKAGGLEDASEDPMMSDSTIVLDADKKVTTSMMMTTQSKHSHKLQDDDNDTINVTDKAKAMTTPCSTSPTHPKHPRKLQDDGSNTIVVTNKRGLVNAIENASNDTVTTIVVNTTEIDFDRGTAVNETGLDLNNKHLNITCQNYDETNKCTFKRSSRGGRFFFFEGDIFHALFAGIKFERGRATSANAANQKNGGAISLVLEDGNDCPADGCSATFTDCEFHNNRATSKGGAIHIQSSINGVSVSCTRCIFDSNKLNVGGNGGGAISAISSDEDGWVSLDIHESTFTNNNAPFLDTGNDIFGNNRREADNVVLSCTGTMTSTSDLTDDVVVPDIQGFPQTCSATSSPANDWCINATNVELNSTTTGSTIGASLPSGLEGTGCKGVSFGGPGVWYSFIGNGNQVIVSTCNAATFSTRLSVFSGGCMNGADDGANICIGANNNADGCGSSSELQVDSYNQGQYHILVYGREGKTGHFNLTVSDTGIPMTSMPSSSPSDLPTSTPSLSVMQTKVPSMAPTDAPSILPSIAPSAQPSKAPTNAPSAQPSVGNFPSAEPTIPPLPANDLCINAINVELNSITSGTTSGATLASGLHGRYCGGESFHGPGVWYSFNGNGNQVIVSTCNAATFSTRLSVFSGGCINGVDGDGAATCIGANNNADDCSGGSSEFQFGSVSGVQYHILVHGREGKTGFFNLTVSDTGIASPPRPMNDFCINAIDVELNSTTSGSTIGATALDDGFAGTLCGPISIFHPDVWYTFTGNGNRVIISTCNATDFDMELTILSGNCVNESDTAEVCLGYNYNGCGGGTSKFEFGSSLGVQYFIVVFGLTGTGNFNLTVSDTGIETPPPPANDLCKNATSVEIGSTVSGSTIDATIPEGIAGTICGGGLMVTGAAVWYSIVGNGNRLLLSTCNEVTYDTQLSVYGDECMESSSDGATVCVGGNDDQDGCFVGSVFEFDSHNGVKYLVLVNSWLGDRGNFNLTISDTGILSPTAEPSESLQPSKAPSSHLPTLENPLTPLPTTQYPSTPFPITQAPSTGLPTTQEPKPTTPMPSTPVPTTPKPLTPQPSTLMPSTPEPATSMPLTPEPTTTMPSTTEPTTPMPSTTEPITPMPSTPLPTTPMPSASQPITPMPLTPVPTIPKSSTPEPTTAMPLTPEPTTPVPLTSNPTTLMPSTSDTTTPMPSTPVPTTPMPSTREPSNPLPSTPDPTTPMPSTPEPFTPIPSTPVQPTPMSSTPEPSTPLPSTLEPTTQKPKTEPPSKPPSPSPTSDSTNDNPQPMCYVKQCCEDQCCGPGTVWIARVGCRKKEGAAGYQGRHSVHQKGCNVWMCCEADCCHRALGTDYDPKAKFCLPVPDEENEYFQLNNKMADLVRNKNMKNAKGMKKNDNKKSKGN